jgi:hypothetical protein
MSPEPMEMMSERELRVRLRELADATRSSAASPAVADRLLRAFAETVADRPRQSPRVRWFPAAVFSFALLLATTGLVIQTWPLRIAGNRAMSSSTVVEPLAGFQPIPGASALPRLESARIVTSEVPLTTLRAYGLEIVPEPNRPTIGAEFLIGQDGYARAIRVMEPNRFGR